MDTEKVLEISQIDVNFKREYNIGEEGIKFRNILDKPFKIYGVFMENGKFRRIPEEVAKTVNPGVHLLHANTAGGRVRFQTDSRYVAIVVKLGKVGEMPHFALTGSAGFDMYVKEEQGEDYAGTFVPPYKIEGKYDGIIRFEDKRLREITINFPLYSEVEDLCIGLEEECILCEPKPYRIDTPIIYYGSSITQGGCASRPGNSYQSIISRRLDCDFWNLGFSGNARGEETIANYVKELPMSVFVYDYDHNAPNVEHLANTHEKMFRIVRKQNPELPIIMLSRHDNTDNMEMRRIIVEATYRNAIEGGDKNVYFIDGRYLMNMAGCDGTVDGTHPNDLGFASMAQPIGDLLEELLIQK